MDSFSIYCALCSGPLESQYIETGSQLARDLRRRDEFVRMCRDAVRTKSAVKYEDSEELSPSTESQDENNEDIEGNTDNENIEQQQTREFLDRYDLENAYDPRLMQADGTEVEWLDDIVAVGYNAIATESKRYKCPNSQFPSLFLSGT